jgi:hypothetical protein
VLAAVTGIFLIVILLMRNKNDNNNHFSKRRIIWLLLFGVGLSIAVDLVRASLTGSSTGLEQDIEIAQRALGPEHFGARWQVLNATMHDSLGAVFSNFIILVLGLIWVLKSNQREPGTVFLMIFLSVGVVPLFFGNWALQARTFYDIPFEIPAAISLYYLKNRSGSIFVVLATCTWLAAVSMFTVMNYYFIPTPGTR